MSTISVSVAGPEEDEDEDEDSVSILVDMHLELIWYLPTYLPKVPTY